MDNAGSKRRNFPDNLTSETTFFWLIFSLTMSKLISESEHKRLESLKSFRILDTLPEQEFDDLALLASQICETPIAAISLIDEDRQWFKSRVGLSATETPRDMAFCNHTINGDELFIVPDAREDARFDENPLVTKDPNVRFYAGAPLITSDGQRLGSLCVIDRRARELSEEQKTALSALSRSVIRLLESRRELVNLKNEITESATFLSDEEVAENAKIFKDFSVRKSQNDEHTFFQKHFKHYLIAAVVVVITALIKSMLESVTQIESPFLLFTCAILLAAWRGGLGPGIFATLLTVLIIDYYFVSPSGDIFRRSYEQNMLLLIFVAQGFFVTLLCLSRLRGENVLNYARSQLENRVANRTNQLAQANKILHKEIRERGVLQEDLRQARDSALESVRLKSDFLANMSHEIRTPMNGVIGVTGLLLDTKLDGEQKRYAEIIRNSGESLLTVINDILDFSKVEAGKLELETLDFNLQNTIESTVELLTAKAHSQKNELATLIYNDVPLNLRGDAGRIQQILTNLIGNAVKFTREGDIVVRIKKIEEDDSHVKLKFSVADTGEGISSEAQEKLFQPFTQSDASTTRRFGGTGLGLSISKKLVELMDGKIGVDSEVGKGSTFWFDISLEKQKLSNTVNNDAMKSFISHPPLSGRRVLVVDDNPVNREVLLYQMRSWNMNAQEAASGFEAIGLINAAAAAAAPIDLVIMDLHMPGINGMETARRMLKENEAESPSTILLSSSTLKIDVESLREAGISASLNKPYRQNDLLEKIYETLDLKRRGKGANNFSIHTSITADFNAAANSENLMMNGKQRRILLVEDNQVNQLVAQTLLKKFGYQADVAGNGLEAIKALELLPYDLVLMDCQMPEMDGYEATRAIRSRNWKAAKIPIIALTAHAIEGEREKCLNAGMDDYISKPVQKDALQAILNRWLAVVESKETKRAVSYAAPGNHITPANLSNPVNYYEDEKETLNYDAEIIVLEPVEESVEPADEPYFAAVDFAALDEITDNDNEMRREVLEMYLAQTATQLDEIERAIIVNDANALSSVAHKSVGGSALCGMTGIVEPMRKLERMGLDGKTEEAASFLAQARRAFVSINKQCLELLRK